MSTHGILKSILQVLLVFLLFAYLLPELLDSLFENLDLFIWSQFVDVLHVEVSWDQLWCVFLHGSPLIPR